MQRKPGLAAVFFLVVLIVFQGLAPDLQAQATPVPSPQQLDQLLAPVALYPDSLLAQITTASTNPQGIMHAKIIVTDSAYALGSYNWTASATLYNDEVLEVGTDEGLREQWLDVVKKILRHNQ